MIRYSPVVQMNHPKFGPAWIQTSYLTRYDWKTPARGNSHPWLCHGYPCYLRWKWPCRKLKNSWMMVRHPRMWSRIFLHASLSHLVKRWGGWVGGHEAIKWNCRRLLCWIIFCWGCRAFFRFSWNMFEGLMNDPWGLAYFIMHHYVQDDILDIHYPQFLYIYSV